jgi:hypothetical protein
MLRSVSRAIGRASIGTTTGQFWSLTNHTNGRAWTLISNIPPTSQGSVRHQPQRCLSESSVSATGSDASATPTTTPVNTNTDKATPRPLHQLNELVVPQGELPRVTLAAFLYVRPLVLM